MKLFAPVFLAFAILVPGVVAASFFLEYRGLKIMLEGGITSTVAGRVEDFKSQAKAGRVTESFRVRGVRFHYTDRAITHAFHATRARGGPLREGLRVRITYGKFMESRPILRLEADKTQGPFPAPRLPAGRRRLAAGAAAGVALLLALARAKRGKLRRPFRWGEARFAESLVSGRSLRGRWSRLARISNGLVVAVTDSHLHVYPIFPFGLLPVFRGLDEDIPLGRIVSVERGKFLFRQGARISYRDDCGTEQKLEVYPSRLDALIKVLETSPI